MTYSEKLKDPRWQKKRLEIFNRDGFTCQKCGDTETTLNIHHLSYSKTTDPWDVENHQLITLCEDCHKLISEFLKTAINKDFFEVLKIKKNGEKFILVYRENMLDLILPGETSSITFMPETIKKILHFLIDSSLKHG